MQFIPEGPGRDSLLLFISQQRIWQRLKHLLKPAKGGLHANVLKLMLDSLKRDICGLEI